MNRSKWISVKECLPPVDEWVIVHIRGEIITVARRFDESPSSWVGHTSYYWDFVTHWMFLPDPPTTKKESNVDEPIITPIEKIPFPVDDEPVLSPVDTKSLDQWDVELRLETDTCGDCIKHLSESCPEHTVMSHNTARIQVDPISSHVTCRGFERWQRDCTCGPDAHVNCKNHVPTPEA